MSNRSDSIAALLSDVDGTLVTKDKQLTPATQEAVAALHARGIHFAITSSRPPRGLRMLVEPLAMAMPIAGFNGGLVMRPSGEAVERHPLSPEIARAAISGLMTQSVDVWVFTATDWLVANPSNPLIDHEKRTVQFAPLVVPDFTDPTLEIYKIVGVGNDPALLERCEAQLRSRLGDGATVARSQSYYLDITHPKANKGDVIAALAARLDLPLARIAAIGDGRNDVAMFAKAGLSVAMGNAAPEVQAAADHVTDSNEEDGFAKAVRRFILCMEDVP